MILQKHFEHLYPHLFHRDSFTIIPPPGDEKLRKTFNFFRFFKLVMKGWDVGCSTYDTDAAFYSCDNPPENSCCDGYTLKGTSEDNMQCVPTDWDDYEFTCAGTGMSLHFSWVGEPMNKLMHDLVLDTPCFFSFFSIKKIPCFLSFLKFIKTRAGKPCRPVKSNEWIFNRVDINIKNMIWKCWF